MSPSSVHSITTVNGAGAGAGVLGFVANPERTSEQCLEVIHDITHGERTAPEEATGTPIDSTGQSLRNRWMSSPSVLGCCWKQNTRERGFVSSLDMSTGHVSIGGRFSVSLL